MKLVLEGVTNVQNGSRDDTENRSTENPSLLNPNHTCVILIRAFLLDHEHC